MVKRPPAGPHSERHAPERRGSLTSEDRRVWTRVSGSVTPPKVRKAERVVPAGPLPADPPASVALTGPAGKVRRVVIPKTPAKPDLISPLAARAGKSAPEELEPRRQRRLSRERDPIEDRIDLHGFGRFEAEDQLRMFLSGAQARGLRAVLVITGQGRIGGGVIRASIHEWLQSPALRPVVSGFAIAHQRHGGDGAIYVTLKRR